MKKITFLPLIASLMLLSGCVNLPGAEISDVGLLGLGEPEYTVPEEISVAVQAVPGNVRPGRRMEAFFDIDNTGNTTLENVRLDDVDNCVFNLQEKEGIDGTNLEPLDKKSPTWTFEAPENVTMDKRCDMRYRVSYDSTAHALFNVRALSEDEYITREKAGDLAGLSDVRYEKTRTPVEIMAEVSEEQPMIEGESFLVHFHIENKGDGFVDEDGFKPGDIRLSFPGDILDPVGCQGMEVDIEDLGKKFELDCVSEDTYKCDEEGIDCGEDDDCVVEGCESVECPDAPDNAEFVEGSGDCRVEHGCSCYPTFNDHMQTTDPIDGHKCHGVGGDCRAYGTCTYECKEDYRWDGNECIEFDPEKNNWENNEIIFKDIDFRNGRTAKTSCRFSIDEEIDTSETGTFRMSVDYRYVNDGLFEVSIVP